MKRKKCKLPYVVFRTYLNLFLLSTLANLAYADEMPKPLGRQDFGSETIQYLERMKHSTEPLPLDLVEEPDTNAPRDKQTADDRTANNQNAKNPAQFLSNLDPSDKDALAEMTTVLNGSDIELSALIKTFSKLAKRNYIVDGKVKGKVTMHLPTPVSVEEALRVFDTVLLLKGYTTIPVTENIWKVIPAKDAKQTTVPLYRNAVDNPSDVLVTERIRLRYITAEDGENLLKSFVSKEGTLKAIAGSNSLIIIDSQANIARLRELLAEVDVPAVDREITIVPIAHAEASDLAEKINEILGSDEEEQQETIASNRTALRRRLASRNQANAAAEDSSSERRTLPFKIIPDERTNSLIIVADREMTLKVQALVDQLDSELDRSAGRFWVYGLKHGDAEALAEILNNLISGAGETSDSSGSSTQGSSLSRSTRSSSRNSGGANTARLTQALARSRQLLARSRGQTGADGGRVSLEGEVSITADPATNSIIINASKTDYLRLKEVVDLLDVKRRQVLVEATILEVTLSDDEGMGIELQGTAGIDDKGGVITQTNFGSITNLLTNPAALTDLTIAAASSGTLTLPGGLVIPSQAVLISAVSRHSNVNVLSSPTILATDNEEAEIIVGENVPFVTSTSTDSANIGNTFNQVERQDVGITLRITPQISSGDYVNLRMFVEISNVVAGTRNDPNGPTTTIRTTETSVEVKNSQMVVTGGLIQDSITDSTRGVPFFQDIPVVGQYFQRQDNNTRRTNLLIFITPKIINDQFEAREQTREKADELGRKFEEFDMEPKRDDVLKSENIDNVAQEYIDEGLLPPTTVVPSKPHSSSKQGISYSAVPSTRFETKVQVLPELPSKPRAPRESLSEIDSSGIVGDSPAVSATLSKEQADIIDVVASPQLPSVELPSAELPSAELPSAKRSEADGIIEQDLKTTPSEARQRLKPEITQPSVQKRTFTDEAGDTGQTFVVLRKLRGDSATGINLANDSSTLGLQLKSPIGSRASDFFQVGGKYSNSDGAGEYVCLGIYSSSSQASSVHPVLKNNDGWNSLSTMDTLALGENNWSKGFK